MDSMLFERTAISKKPEQTIVNELKIIAGKIGKSHSYSRKYQQKINGQEFNKTTSLYKTV